MEHARALRDAGYSVAICPGPDSRERCPLTGPPGCALAHGADVVVSSLGLERPEAREVLKELRLQCPGVPLIVEAAGGDEDEWQDLLRGCEVIAAPARPDRLVAAVDAAFAARRWEP